MSCKCENWTQLKKKVFVILMEVKNQYFVFPNFRKELFNPLNDDRRFT